MSSQLVEACDLIQKKCKEMEINFLKHQCINLQPLVVGDTVAKRVDNYKLLGVYISSDLSWNVHVDFIVKKATKRLCSLRVLRKAGVQQADLVRIYCSLIRSVLEYGAPVWSALPGYLSNIIESVQRRALRIICPWLNMRLHLLVLVLSLFMPALQTCQLSFLGRLRRPYP